MPPRSPDKRGTRVIRGGCLRLRFPDDVAAQLIRATSELDAKTVGYTKVSFSRLCYIYNYLRRYTLSTG